MELSLEMFVVTGTFTAAITSLFPSKSKPVQEIIMSMSWFQPYAIQHTAQVIYFHEFFLHINDVCVSVH